jgi:hypothetical protein
MEQWSASLLAIRHSPSRVLTMRSRNVAWRYITLRHT